MNRNQHILNELREISPVLAEIPPVNVFQVPNGYFDRMAAGILLQINPENGILPVNKKAGFEVPEGYFDGFAGSIMNRIKTEAVPDAREEINILSPVLAGISREMPFQIPHSYFNNLSARIMDQRNETKVVNIVNNRSIMPRWMKMAAAACIMALLAFGAYRLIPWGKNNGTGTELAAVPTQEQLKNFDLDKELEKLSSGDLNNYLCETGIACAEDKKDDDLSKQLSEISDDDLKDYLEGMN